MSNLIINLEATQKQWHAEIQIGGIYARGKMLNGQYDSYDEAMAAVRDALKVIMPRDLVALYKLGDPADELKAANASDPRVDSLAKARAAKAAKRAAPANPEQEAALIAFRADAAAKAKEPT